MTESLADPKRRRIKLAAITAVLVAVVGGALAFAHSGGGRHGPAAANSTEDHLARIQGLLTRIGASEAQKTQIAGLLKPALNDMKATRDAHHEVFREFHEAISAASIDRARLESLRAEQVKSLDEASKRLVVAIGDAAEVLSPDQRAQLAQEIRKLHGG